jgi:hypothetical protein
MPNHCDNRLEIFGKAKAINKLMKQVEITESESTAQHEKTIFSCHKVIPQPSFVGDEWYSWNVSNWGSKWGAYDINESGDWEEGYWILTFNTAWSPITPVIAELASQHPKLEFLYSYYEGGSDFWGKETYKGGEKISEEGGELSSASCEIREEAYGSEHHWCRICSNPYSCNGNDEMCDECLEDEMKIQEQLLDETENNTGESNLVSAGTDN